MYLHHNNPLYHNQIQEKWRVEAIFNFFLRVRTREILYTKCKYLYIIVR